MSIGSIGSSPFDISGMRDRMQAFREGKDNIDKEDLAELQSKLEEEGADTPTQLQSLIDNFDIIDANGDGISHDELGDFGKEQGRPPGMGPGMRPDMSKEDMIALRDQGAADGKDTKPLDDLIENYDEADTNEDGELSLAEMQAYAEANGMKPPPRGGPHGQIRPGSDEDDEEDDDSNSDILKLALQAYANANQSYQDTALTSLFEGLSA